MIVTIQGFYFRVQSEEEKDFLLSETEGKDFYEVQEVFGHWNVACAESELYPTEDESTMGEGENG